MHEHGEAGITPESRIGELLERWPERSGAGLSPIAVPDDAGAAATERPAWAVEEAAVRTLDARAAIESGEHPMPQVMDDLAKLGGGQVYQLVTPYVPALLLDLARAKGFASFSVTVAPGLVRTFFRMEG